MIVRCSSLLGTSSENVLSGLYENSPRVAGAASMDRRLMSSLCALSLLSSSLIAESSAKYGWTYPTTWKKLASPVLKRSSMRRPVLSMREPSSPLGSKRCSRFLQTTRLHRRSFMSTGLVCKSS